MAEYRSAMAESPPRRVFLSHTTELREFPAGRSFVEAAVAAVNRTGGGVIDMAYFSAADDKPSDHCQGLVRSCDVYIGLIGLRYGSPVRDRTEVSYTELEFETATNAGMPRLVFMLDESSVVPIPPARLLDQEPDFQARQRRFRARLLDADVAIRTFSSPEQLELEIFHALKSLPEPSAAPDTGPLLGSRRHLAGSERAELDTAARGIPADGAGSMVASTRCRVVGTPVSYGLEAFKDRHPQLEQVLLWLADPAIRVITVFGRRGIGKSALAAKVATTLATSGSGCRGIVNLSTRIDGALTLERIFFACSQLGSLASKEELEALWAGSLDPRDKLIELFAALGEGMHLIVLDNLEDQLSDDGHPHARDLETFFDVVFRAARAPRVLVTSQVPVALDPAMRRMEARLHLADGLPVEDCVELLRELDRDGEAGLLDASRADLEQAARRLHGVPRALELAVGVLADDHFTVPTLDDLLNDFASRGDIVGQLAQDRYQRLDDDARITLNVLAVFASPVTAEHVEWVVRPLAPGLDSARALSRLAHVHMVSVNRPSREFGLHPLDADIAYAALPEQGQLGRRSLERRVAAWYESNRVRPPWDSTADVANHRRQYDHLLRAGDYDACAFVLDEINEFLIWHGSSREVIGMHDAIQDHLQDQTAVLAHLVGYGHALDRGGSLEEAVRPLRQATALAERIGDKRQLERALLALGDALKDVHRLREAVDVLTQAATIAGELGNSGHQAHALLQLSLSLTYLGDTPAALEVAGRLGLLAAEDDRPLIHAQAANARSAAYIAASRWTDAISAAEQAARDYEISDMPALLGYVNNGHGIGLLGLGRADEAKLLLNQAWMDGVDVQYPRIEGLSLYNVSIHGGRACEQRPAVR